jgi:hypothetical protein
MKPSTVKKSIQATKKVAKTAALKKPIKYKNVGGVGSSPKSGNSPSPIIPSPIIPSPRSGSPRSGNSPSISISKEDKKKEIDISYDISYHLVALINNYKALSEVSVNKYSFKELDTSKTDFLIFTQVTTKKIRDEIDEIFVKINKLQFISIDTSTYNIFRLKYDVDINRIINRINLLTTNEFINEAIEFFDYLRNVLLIFFYYIQTNIKINAGISDKEIIKVVNAEILRCAIGGYAWLSDKKNKELGDKNIKLFMDIRRENIKERERAEFLKNIKIERTHAAISGLLACKPNRGKSCR